MLLEVVAIVTVLCSKLCAAEYQDNKLKEKVPYHSPVPIPASSEAHFSVHNPLDGTYHFGYDTDYICNGFICGAVQSRNYALSYHHFHGGSIHQSYREEKRDAKGRVKGKYGYVDPSGILRVIEYEADENGYRSNLVSHFPVNPSLPSFIGPIPTPLLKHLLYTGLK